MLNSPPIFRSKQVNQQLKFLQRSQSFDERHATTEWSPEQPFIWIPDATPEALSQITIFRPRTGHRRLRAHLHRHGLSHTVGCPCKAGPQGPERTLHQTPSTGLRHLSFGGRCQKEMLGVWLCPYKAGPQAQNMLCPCKIGHKAQKILNTERPLYKETCIQHWSQGTTIAEKLWGRKRTCCTQTTKFTNTINAM